MLERGVGSDIDTVLKVTQNPADYGFVLVVKKAHLTPLKSELHKPYLQGFRRVFLNRRHERLRQRSQYLTTLPKHIGQPICEVEAGCSKQIPGMRYRMEATGI